MKDASPSPSGARFTIYQDSRSLAAAWMGRVHSTHEHRMISPSFELDIYWHRGHPVCE